MSIAKSKFVLNESHTYKDYFTKLESIDTGNYKKYFVLMYVEYKWTYVEDRIFGWEVKNTWIFNKNKDKIAHKNVNKVVIRSESLKLKKTYIM